MKTIKFGIIGAGNIANKFCDAIKQIKNAKVIAVASKSIDKAKEFASKHNIDNYFDSYETMLKTSEIDVVYIATTHNYHFENTMLCLDYKKNVICEKCFCLSYSDAKTCFDYAKKQNCFLMEAMWARFLPHIKRAKEWIINGDIGTVQLASSSIGFKANTDPTARYFSPDLAGGAMYDITVYPIEVMTFLLGCNPKEIITSALFTELGVDKTNNVTLVYDNFITNIQASFMSNVPNNTVICGSDGYIQFEGSFFSGECKLFKNGECVEHYNAEITNGFIYEILEVIECIENGRIESEIMSSNDTLFCAKIFDNIKNLYN